MSVLDDLDPIEFLTECCREVKLHDPLITGNALGEMSIRLVKSFSRVTPEPRFEKFHYAQGLRLLERGFGEIDFV